MGTTNAMLPTPAPPAGRETMFKTPLSFTIPSFLLGAAMGLDMGATLRPRSYREYLAKPNDAQALLSDFVVIGDDLEEVLMVELKKAAAPYAASETETETDAG